ncbi:MULTISPECIES: class F sortase [unclassified Streptomyces]|uniref:class F sortase n=1 Tax=unclassified Streptomyces TaxID=2593676 RepID=UPI0029A7120B|nr:class F sortase [Streptomyces sp. DK15]MDX2392912.1 class F sortase [Streptomyces sp. DK15]
MSEDRATPGGRLLTFTAWSVLVLGLWLWGKEITGVPPGAQAGQGGGPVAAGMPAAHAPMSGVMPARVDVPSIGVQAPVISRGLDSRGSIDPPPYELPGTVGWWGAGAAPGAAGTALMVGHVDTKSKPAVFFGLSTVKPGAKIRVARADGSVAEFTVEDVKTYERTEFDPKKAYGPRVDGRAELRLVTCGGNYDKAAKQYSANVVVSAYLTGTGFRSGTEV